MARPAGVLKVTKDNSRKRPQQADEWMIAKKIGRSKQQFDPVKKTWAKVKSC